MLLTGAAMQCPKLRDGVSDQAFSSLKALLLPCQPL